MQQPSTSRLESINFLRGGTALAVVLHHAIRYGEAPLDSPLWFRGVYAVLDLGHLGVPLFFVLSGFCIHLRWAKQYAVSLSVRAGLRGLLEAAAPPFVSAIRRDLVLQHGAGAGGVSDSGQRTAGDLLSGAGLEVDRDRFLRPLGDVTRPSPSLTRRGESLLLDARARNTSI